MEKATIQDLVWRRQYSELENQAEEFIQSNDWAGFMDHIRNARSSGKARDAVVALLELDAVGGTDSDVFKEFSSLEGTSLQNIRVDAVEQAMEILKEQIENRHTYFLDVEAMSETPYAILVKDIIEARQREIAQLEGTPSRLDVLGTFYGFMILLTDGSKPYDASSMGTQNYGYRYYYKHRRSWLDESITDSAADAIKKLTGDLAEPIEMDKTYRTIGNSSVFKKRCQKTTAAILADSVRLALYKVPGNRGAAARSLARTEDSRALEFLHHRLRLEQNRYVRASIATALGRIGHESSIDPLENLVQQQTHRYSSKESLAAVDALGGINSPRVRSVLLELMKVGKNEVKASAIQALSRQGTPGLVKVISPYLKHASRPVVRSSVTALLNLGREGEEAVKLAMPMVLSRMGTDKGSKAVLTKMLQLSDVGQMSLVQDYFAMRIKKQTSNVKRWQARSISTSYSYYWNRREIRARNELEWWLDLVSKHIHPPFSESLVNCIKSLFSSVSDSIRFSTILSKGPLAEEIGLRNFQPLPRKSSQSPSEPNYFV
ncbi:MAG: HEAT repeat domain-containing protein [Candidatus Odinarchaeota archaeon]